MMKIILSLLLLFNIAKADEYGLIEAAILAAISAISVQMTVERLENVNDEMGKTVKMNREILKAEIVRSTLLSKKIYWLRKIKNNLSRSVDMDGTSVQVNTLNNKIWIYNNSFLYGNLYTKDKNE